MNITKENYEVFVLDYLEGKLDTDMLGDFLLFLKDNPEIRKEIETFEMFELSSSGPDYTEKNLLKKKDIDLLDVIPDFEKACIAAIEKDLDEPAYEKLHRELMHFPEKGLTFQEFNKTILKPEPIAFDAKSLLKKPVPIGRKNKVMVWYAVASVILLFLLIQPFSRDGFQYEAVVQSVQGPAVDSKEIHPAENNNDGNNEKARGAIPSNVLTSSSKQTENNNKTLLLASVSGEESIFPEKLRKEPEMGSLTGISGILPQENINTLTLHAPVIYIPVYLDVKELKALETMTVSDFKVRIIQEPPEHKSTSALMALFRTGIKKLNKGAGSDAEIELPVKEKGILTAFVFNSPNLKIHRKAKEKTAKITPHP